MAQWREDLRQRERFWVRLADGSMICTRISKYSCGMYILGKQSYSQNARKGIKYTCVNTLHKHAVEIEARMRTRHA